MERSKDKHGKEDYLIVLTNTVAYQALRCYKKRWSIEVMFQDFKQQGFHLESTHLRQGYKIVKLLYLVSVAYCFCVHVGLCIEQEQGIKVKKHGYRANSVPRKGLDMLRRILSKKFHDFEQYWLQLVNKFIHLAIIQLRKYG